MRTLVAAGLALVFGLAILGSPAPVRAASLPVRAAPPVIAAASPVGVGDIVAGSVNRMSLAVTATYDARLRIWWSQHRIRVDATIRVTNTSAGPIDRVELNTIAARIGNIALDPVTVDGVAVKATRSDQTIVVPLGGILPMGGTTSIRVRFGATLHTNLSGSNWMFTKANGIIDLYRWLPWVSRRTTFARPNHGDPFVTPSSPSVHVRIVTDRKLTFATSGERTGLSSDGLTLDYTATDVRDFTVTAAADYRIASRTVGDNVVRVYYRPGGPGPAMLDGTADAFKAMEALLGPYPYPTLRVVQSSGAYGMESPGMIWIPTGAPSANLRYLTAHETAHQWFYGIVGNDQARQPFADEAAADFVARHVTGLQRSPRCSAGRLDLQIYDYSSTCYYERIYIQGGNLLESARKRIGPSAFWAAMRKYIVDHRFGLSSNATLLQALDDATPKDLGGTLFAPRFPSIY